MTPGHIALALLIPFAWALNFIVVVVGLHSVPPLLLLALRFVVAALPVVFIPRPTLPWSQLIAIASTAFILQFGFLFSAIASGMSVGMASVIQQSQAVFTAVLSAVVLREPPTVPQAVGIGIAVSGMVVVGSTIGTGGITLVGVLFTLASALSTSVANIQLRSVRNQNMMAMMVWMSLVPPLPFFVLSLLLEGGAQDMVHVLASMGWREVGVVLYIVVISTYLGHGGWAYLLKFYSATTIAPFALLVPVFAAVLSALFLGEQFGEMRLLGMGLVLAGLAVIIAPFRRRSVPSPEAS